MESKRPTIHRHNEAKYLILKTLFTAHRYLSPKEITQKTGIPLNVATERLRRYTKQGYIWRREEFRANRKNQYCYGFLKPMGIRVFALLDDRVKLQEETGVHIPLNLKKPIPQEARERKRRQGGAVYT